MAHYGGWLSGLSDCLVDDLIELMHVVYVDPFFLCNDEDAGSGANI